MICLRCKQEKDEDFIDICSACKKAEKNRYNVIRANKNWMEYAEENGIELWERQPGETDNEYAAWSMYRNSYPHKKPSLKEVSETTGIPYRTVLDYSRRWNFATRMQAWVKNVDDQVMAERRQEILDMNRQHMTMAAKLNDKIATAIDMINPELLSPRDLNSLMKTATDLERKARVDEYAVQTAGNPNALVVDDNPELKNTKVKTSDISEIVKILAGAGALDNVGIRQTTTTTTEVVKQGD